MLPSSGSITPNINLFSFLLPSGAIVANVSTWWKMDALCFTVEKIEEGEKLNLFLLPASSLCVKSDPFDVCSPLLFIDLLSIGFLTDKCMQNRLNPA